MEFNKKVNWQTHTDGKGFWSLFAQAVTVTQIELAYANEDVDFGELVAYFDTSTWDVNKNGLIYTDPRWLEEFRALMRSLGFTSRACEDINYSEQGMQGDNYVSMDVGADFLREIEPLYRWAINKQPVFG